MKLKSVDTPFLVVTCVIVVFGLLVFTSAALGLLARNGASFTSVATSQVLLGLVSGSIALVIISRLDYRKWREYTPYFFGFAFLLTALTLTHMGLTLKGASRWLVVGPISFQPEEILKFATVLFLAAIYASRIRDIKTWKASLLPLAFVAGSAAALLLLQPNTAGAFILAIACAGMLFAAGGRLTYFVLFAVLGVGALAGAAMVYPHVASRLETYLDQGSDPQGAGWQTQQSLIAIGSGGFSGKGFGQSEEKFSYLPEPIGDSIFAVLGEEFGLIGSAALVTLFTLFTLFGLRIAARAPDPFGALTVVGLVLIISVQSFFNMASALALVPLIGVPLIFVSHGGTALAISLAEIGVILSISRHMKR